MTYIALDKKPDCRLYRVTSKRRIPNPRPFFLTGKDGVSWWSDGKRVLLKVIEHTVRSARDAKTGGNVRLQETREHWYALTNGRT